MFRNPSPKAPAFPQAPSTEPPASSSDTSSTRPDPLPWQTPNEAQEDAQRRLDAMEREEPKRRLIRDAKALAKLHRITQAQMAEAMGGGAFKGRVTCFLQACRASAASRFDGKE